MIARICVDGAFGLSRAEIEAELEPVKFTGRSCEQVEEYLRDFVRPKLDENRTLLGERAALSV